MLQPCATTDPMLLQSQVLVKTRDSEQWEEISFGDVNTSRLGRVGGIWAAGARGLLIIEEDTHFPSLHFLTLSSAGPQCLQPGFSFCFLGVAGDAGGCWSSDDSEKFFADTLPALWCTRYVGIFGRQKAVRWVIGSYLETQSWCF